MLSSLFSVYALYFLIIIIPLIVLYKRYKRRKTEQYWTEKNVPVGNVPATLTILYKMLFKRKPLQEFQVEMVRDNGRLYGVQQFGQINIVTTDPEVICSVLTKQFTKFTNRRKIEMSFDPIMGNMISVAVDDTWKRLRTIVSPTFSTGKLRRMRPLIDDCLQNLVTNINKSLKDNARQELDMKKILSAFTMETIIQVAFGTKVDVLGDENHPIIANARQLFSTEFSLRQIPKSLVLLFLPRVARFFGLSFLPKKTTDFFLNLTREIIAERKKNSDEKRYDFLQLLLDANENLNNNEDGNNLKGLTEIELMSQCLLFFFAGYETVATTLSFATYFIAKYPECQQKLHEESIKIFESNTDLDYDAIERIQYVDAFLNETLRLYPPAIEIERRASEDTVLDKDEIKVSKDDLIAIPVYALHRDPTQFAAPDRFDPDRFLPDNCTHHPYAYLPFGAGPRNCVAKRLALMEAKLAILHLVYHFKLGFTDKTDDPPELFYTSLLSPKRILVKVEPRNQ